MIDIVKKFFASDAADVPGGKPTRSSHDIRVATCALFIEMANIDGEFADAEKEQIVKMLTNDYELSNEYARELTRVAREQLDGSIDMWRFTNLINQNYSNEEKIQVVELLWRLVYADGKLSEHENYLIHKLGKMLRLTHRELINAKLAVLAEKGDSATES